MHTGAKANARLETRGFSLVELMVVIAIMGVLAALGLTMTRKHIDSSRASEALSTIQAIRVAEEQWRAHHQTYLNVSATTTSWYPMATPNSTQHHWVQSSGADYSNWQLLGPRVDWPVRMGYVVVAGMAGQDIPALETIEDAPTFGVPEQPWYVIQAKSDANGDGSFGYFVATSFSSEIYSEKSGE